MALAAAKESAGITELVANPRICPKAIQAEAMAKMGLAFVRILKALKKGTKRKNKMAAKKVKRTLPESISTATEQLAAAILRAEPIAAYQEAKARLDADPEACELLERFASAQADLRKRQSKNAITQTDMDELRALQRQVQSNLRIMDFAETQQEAAAYLPEVNLEISELLGVDFASLAGPASC